MAKCPSCSESIELKLKGECSYCNKYIEMHPIQAGGVVGGLIFLFIILLLILKINFDISVHYVFPIMFFISAIIFTKMSGYKITLTSPGEKFGKCEAWNLKAAAKYSSCTMVLLYLGYIGQFYKSGDTLNTSAIALSFLLFFLSFFTDKFRVHMFLVGLVFLYVSLLV